MFVTVSSSISVSSCPASPSRSPSPSPSSSPCSPSCSSPSTSPSPSSVPFSPSSPSPSSPSSTSPFSSCPSNGGKLRCFQSSISSMILFNRSLMLSTAKLPNSSLSGGYRQWPNCQTSSAALTTLVGWFAPIHCNVLWACAAGESFAEYGSLALATLKCPNRPNLCPLAMVCTSSSLLRCPGSTSVSFTPN